MLVNIGYLKPTFRSDGACLWYFNYFYQHYIPLGFCIINTIAYFKRYHIKLLSFVVRYISNKNLKKLSKHICLKLKDLLPLQSCLGDGLSLLSVIIFN
jgi:hypothetical protein